jgi:Zn-dependent peptidase ImmA (M78 family)
MNNNQTHTPEDRRGSIFAALRGLVPSRSLTFIEALLIAELQANRLRTLLGVDDAFDGELIDGLPHLVVQERPRLPVSGFSFWQHGTWVIALNADEPRVRRRFTLLHELKHVLDHGRTARLYAGTSATSGERQAEQAADYFAGCALAPKRILKTAFFTGMQEPSALADFFDISLPAIRVRLAQTGLSDNSDRCAVSSRAKRHQQTERSDGLMLRTAA